MSNFGVRVALDTALDQSQGLPFDKVLLNSAGLPGAETRRLRCPLATLAATIALSCGVRVALDTALDQSQGLPFDKGLLDLDEGVPVRKARTLRCPLAKLAATLSSSHVECS